MSYSDLSDDPSLSSKRHQLVTAAARELVKTRMITFNESSEAFTITERGQIAAKYYIRHRSIEIFNKEMRPVMSEADALRLISKSTEVRVFSTLDQEAQERVPQFEQIQLRDNEVTELKGFLDDQNIVPCEVNVRAVCHTDVEDATHAFLEASCCRFSIR